jgi:hypothetical protein
LKVKKHIQAVATTSSRVGFDAARAAWLWRSIIVPMLLGGMEVSALLPSAALADDSLSQMKPKLVYNTRAAARDGTAARSSERGGAMCGIMCDPFLIVALNVAALALFLLPAKVRACVTPV